MMSESFRRLQARKMSKRRARSDLPTQMKDSKRKSTVTVEEFTFCEEGVTSKIDTIFSDFRGYHSPINDLFQADSVEFMADKILENPGFVEFFATTKLRMKAFLNFVEKKVKISTEDETSLLRGVWLDPCFFGSLAAAIDYDDDIVQSILMYLKQGTVAERIDRMKADPIFEDSVRGLREFTSKRTFLRLFLSILIGFWGDEVPIRELDQKMGVTRVRQFGWRLTMIAKMRARKIERAGKVDEIDEFSYVIEDINHANDKEPLRNLMLAKYAGREDRDIEAILRKIDLHFLLSISHNHLGYDGKKMEIHVNVINGCPGGIYTKSLPSNKA